MNKVKKIKVKFKQINSDEKAIEGVYNRIFSKAVENISKKDNKK